MSPAIPASSPEAVARWRASARRRGASGSAGRGGAPSAGSCGGSAFIGGPHGKAGAPLPAAEPPPDGRPALRRGAGGGRPGSALGLGPLDRLDDQPLGLLGVAPAGDLHPLARLEVLVVLE